MSASFFDPFDRGPTPESFEGTSDSLWEEFQRLAGAGLLTAGFNDRGKAGAGSRARKQDQCVVTLADVQFRFITSQKGRICLLPSAWEGLYQILLRADRGAGTAPPPPPHPHVWRATSAKAKKMCLTEHLAWAERKGLLEEVFAYLESLSETHWFHSNPEDLTTDGALG